MRHPIRLVDNSKVVRHTSRVLFCVISGTDFRLPKCVAEHSVVGILISEFFGKSEGGEIGKSTS